MILESYAALHSTVALNERLALLPQELINMRTKSRWLRFLTVLGLGLLVALLAFPATSLAVNLLTNGGFELFQLHMEGSQPRTWHGYPEQVGQDWTVTVVDGWDGLHLMDSHTLGQLAATVYGVPYANHQVEGALAQALASQTGYSVVLSQTMAVDAGIDYALGGKIVTFWKGSGGEIDHTKLFKRVGIDPTGGVDYNSTNVEWTDWDGTDDIWTSPAIAASVQTNKATVFIQVENRGEDVGTDTFNSGYLDSFSFERAPATTLNLPSTTPAGALTVTWGATIPNPDYWALWGYDVEYKDNAVGSWQRVQSIDGANNTVTSYTLNAQAGKAYTFRVRAWQQKKPAGDPAIPALPGMWVEKQMAVQGSGEGDPVGNPQENAVFLPIIIDYATPGGSSPDPSPPPSADPDPAPTPAPTPPASANSFAVATVHMLTISENGGCPGNHHVFLSVIDSQGDPLWGAVIGDPPENNFRVTAGDKNEPFFNYGTKMAEIDLYNAGTLLKVMEYPDGTPVTSDQTPLLSTNTWEIPVDWLIGAGYCDDAASCTGLLCQGHYSYWVVFQETGP